MCAACLVSYWPMCFRVLGWLHWFGAKRTSSMYTYSCLLLSTFLLDSQMQYTASTNRNAKDIGQIVEDILKLLSRQLDTTCGLKYHTTLWRSLMYDIPWHWCSQLQICEFICTDLLINFCSWSRIAKVQEKASLPEMETLQCQKTVICKEETNGPLSANKGLSTAKSECSHAVCTFQVNPVPHFLLTVLLFGSDTMKLKISCSKQAKLCIKEEIPRVKVESHLKSGLNHT